MTRRWPFSGPTPPTPRPHLNGTLLEHLSATEGLLRSWGASEQLSLAGLVHAAYGTDGFAPFLLPWQNRRPLARVVGPAVEEIVYLYASCDRSSVYPQLSADGPVAFRIVSPRVPSSSPWPRSGMSWT